MRYEQSAYCTEKTTLSRLSFPYVFCIADPRCWTFHQSRNNPLSGTTRSCSRFDNLHTKRSRRLHFGKRTSPHPNAERRPRDANVGQIARTPQRASCINTLDCFISFFLIPNSMFASSLVRCTRTTATSSRLTSFVPRSQSLLLPFRVNYLSTTTRAMSAFERLIRFEDKDGKTVYGNLEKEVPTKEIEGSSVEVLEGDVKSGFKKTGQKTTVGKVCIRMSIEEKIGALGKS